MIADGYAVLFTFQPNSKYADLFIKAQRIARGKKLGIWGPDGLKERPVEYKKKHPREQRLCWAGTRDTAALHPKSCAVIPIKRRAS